MTKPKKRVDSILGPRCVCGHHKVTHTEDGKECLADMEGPGNDACGTSDCGCQKFEEES